jgi:hypothetical protein
MLGFKVTTYEDPHGAAIIEFENGTQIMVCDASDDSELDENVVVTATVPRGEHVLYRSITLTPGQEQDPENIDAVAPRAGGHGRG